MAEFSIISNCMLLMFLAAVSLQDCHTGSISLYLLGIGGLAGILINLLTGKAQFWNLAMGSFAGMSLLLIAAASREAVGYGDGLLLCATGLFLGWPLNLVLLFLSFLLCFLWSVILLAAGKKKRNDRIVFAPFVLCGYLVLLGTG